VYIYVVHLLVWMINCTICTVHTSTFLLFVYVNVALQKLDNVQMVDCKCVSCTAVKFWHKFRSSKARNALRRSVRVYVFHSLIMRP